MKRLFLVLALFLAFFLTACRLSPVTPLAETPPLPLPQEGEPAPPLEPEKVTQWPPVAILMYHQLGDPPPGHPWPELYVSKDAFAAQLDWLDREGFHPVTLKEVLTAWREGRPLPDKPVVITFDDGYASTVQVGLPLLQAHGFPAVLFLQGNLLNRAGAVSDAMVRTWLEAGMELGSHTMRHLDLTRASEKDLEAEVVGSRSFLETTFDIPVLTFAYPAGRADDRARSMVEQAGYEAAFTTRSACARAEDDPFLLPRLRVNGSDSLEAFARKVSCHP